MAPPPHERYTLKDSLKFYAALGLAGLVWAVTPLSWIAVLYRFGHYYSTTGNFWVPHPRNYFWRLLWYHALCDVPFSLYLIRLHQYAKRDHAPPEAVLKVLALALDRAMSPHTPAGEDATEEKAQTLAKLRRWFHHAEADEVKQDNVREWLAWAFGGTELKDAQNDPERRQLIENGLELVQDRCNVTFQPGYNPKVKALRLTLDDLKTSHRPFGYYVVCNGISRSTIAWLRYKKGYQLERHGRCEFLVLRPSAESDRKRGDHVENRPILLLHGLGIGLGQYIPFLKRLSNHKNGVMILLQPNISADIMHPDYLNPPVKDSLIQAVKLCAQKHHFEQITILSHSNGTMLHGWLLREVGELFRRHVLVDPVCFKLWEGATSYAFLAKPWSSGIEVLLGYFVGRELGISYTISRCFIWWDMIMWAEDLEGLDRLHVNIIMGGNDVLIDVKSVEEYLAHHNFDPKQVHVDKGAQHGQALFLPSWGMRQTCKALGLAF